MSVNKYRPYLYVLPEDDANRQLANGFQSDLADTRKMQILAEAGGWQKVVDCFQEEHIPAMDRNANRFMVLLIDFDQREDRLNNVKAEIPDRLKHRVFVLGVWDEPEKLKHDFGSYETIGQALAKDCRDNTEVTWAHQLLRHNAGEQQRRRTGAFTAASPSHPVSLTGSILLAPAAGMG
jgi:hypothetical protein